MQLRGRRWGRGHAAVALLSLGLLALSACGGGSGGPASRLAADVVDVDGSIDAIAGVVEWRGGLLAVDRSGTVLRADDGGNWETSVAELGGGGNVVGLARAGEVLVAVGSRDVADPGDDGATEPVVWRSENGSIWEGVDATGLSEPGFSVSTHTLTADAEGLVLFGSHRPRRTADDERDDEALDEEDAEQPPSDPDIEGIVLWRSIDGESWQRVGDGGFSDSIDAATVTDDGVVALHAAENGLVVVQLDRS